MSIVPSGAPSGASSSAVSTGLVSSSTSLTPEFRIERDSARVARMQRSVGVGARVIADSLRRGWSCMFITLTYRGDTKVAVAGDISRFLATVRAWLARRNVHASWCWVGELQQRGVIHYHVLLWIPSWIFLPKPDEAGWWDHGSSNVQRARSPLGYITKYASKASSKGGAFRRLYPGVRMHGIGGLSAAQRVVKRFFTAPAWVRERASDGEPRDVRRVSGGWMDVGSGEVWLTPYAIVGWAPDWSWVRFVDKRLAAVV